MLPNPKLSKLDHRTQPEWNNLTNRFGTVAGAAIVVCGLQSPAWARGPGQLGLSTKHSRGGPCVPVIRKTRLAVILLSTKKSPAAEKYLALL